MDKESAKSSCFQGRIKVHFSCNVELLKGVMVMKIFELL